MECPPWTNAVAEANTALPSGGAIFPGLSAISAAGSTPSHLALAQRFEAGAARDRPRLHLLEEPRVLETAGRLCGTDDVGILLRENDQLRFTMAMTAWSAKVCSNAI